MKQSTQHHGGIRGATTQKQSSQFEGRFGRMFRSLPAAQFSAHDLKVLAEGLLDNAGNVLVPGILSEAETDGNGQPIAAPESEADSEENFSIPAGYTYLGQFIDHDITFDPSSSLQKQNDPEALTNFRTPRLDLDCLYGRGPEDQPYLYEFRDGWPARFALSRELKFGDKTSPARDLLRLGGRAVIGDKRNDENVIVSQLQGAMLQFHNRVARAMGKGTSFEAVQQAVRWHYQTIVLHDFLPRICGQAMVHSILPHLASGKSIRDDAPKLRYYRWRHEAFIPIEFSAAAYRFGHSMVRPIYRLNGELNDGGPAVGEDASLQGRSLIFAGISKRALNGFREFPDAWAIDWSLYFGDISTTVFGPKRVQPSYKIDCSMVNPLGFLPEFSKLDDTATGLNKGNFQAQMKPGQISNNLPLRNLMRGQSMGLPSGQAVARAMGVEPLWPDQIKVGKAQVVDNEGKVEATPITELVPGLGNHTPLWAYILAEATHQWEADVAGKTKDNANKVGTRLGEVGGRIVAETLIGLLLADGHSFLAQDPNWKPWAIKPDDQGKPYTMRELLRFAGLQA